MQRLCSFETGRSSSHDSNSASMLSAFSMKPLSAENYISIMNVQRALMRVISPRR